MTTTWLFEKCSLRLLGTKDPPIKTVKEISSFNKDPQNKGDHVQPLIQLPLQNNYQPNEKREDTFLSLIQFTASLHITPSIYKQILTGICSIHSLNESTMSWTWTQVYPLNFWVLVSQRFNHKVSDARMPLKPEEILQLFKKLFKLKTEKNRKQMKSQSTDHLNSFQQTTDKNGSFTQCGTLLLIKATAYWADRPV